MHAVSPHDTIVKAARSTAFEAADSWVTMSSQSRPASIIARTPSI